jgi:hypothetical protein
MEQHALKNVNNCLITNIYSYTEWVYSHCSYAECDHAQYSYAESDYNQC